MSSRLSRIYHGQNSGTDSMTWPITCLLLLSLAQDVSRGLPGV